MKDETKKGESNTSQLEMCAWDMAKSIYAGLQKAEAKADAELQQVLVDCGQNPVGKGTFTARALRRILNDATHSLEVDLLQFARSNKLEMPSRVLPE